MRTFEEFLQWQHASDDVVAVRRVYIDMAQGDLTAGVLLSQIVYWHGVSKHNNRTRLRVKKDGHLWLAKGRDEWWDECRISARQFDRASKILVEEGLIEKKVYKFAGSPQVHVRIIQEPFLVALTAFTDENFQEALDAEDEFVQEEQAILEMAEDAGATVLEDRPGVSMRDVVLEENEDSVKSNSPDGENHNREGSLVSSSSLQSEEETLSPDEKKDKKCKLCRSRNRVSEEIDKKGRCPTCLLVDAWHHFIGNRTPSYSANDKGVREYVGTDNIATINSRMTRRLKDKAFRAGWVYSLQRASYMDYLKEEPWFNPIFFLSNRDGEAVWLRIINGVYDGVNAQRSKASDARLKDWLRQRQAVRATPAASGGE